MERHAGERLLAWLLRATDSLWVACLLVAALVALKVVLAILGFRGWIPDELGNLLRSLIVAGLLAVAAGIWFYRWRGRRATRGLRKHARQRPEDFFPIRPRVGSAASVVGRDQFVDVLAANLSKEFRAGPQVIVGESGSGKTSVLLKLAATSPTRTCCRSCSRSEGSSSRMFDLAELAKDRFREYIDPRLRTAEEADKLWHWLSRKDKIVVLADDLDRATLPASDPAQARCAAGA